QLQSTWAINLVVRIMVFENDQNVNRAAAVHGLHVRGTHTVEPTNYPLTAVVMPARQLTVSLDYDPALFDRATIERMAGHLRMLLDGMVDDPVRAVADLPMLTEAETHRLLVEWNDTSLEVPAVTLPASVE